MVADAISARLTRELMTPSARTRETVGLMISGGVDSAILLVHLLDRGYRVQPIYVSMGCAWDVSERRAVGRFVNALNDDAILPVVDLAMPVGDLYGDHWSITCQGVPDESTPDEAVYLWGRNPLLLVKPVLWCQQNDIAELALGTLASNPFADASQEFFEQFAAALATATETDVTILRPLAGWTKSQILALGAQLPLELTFSCLAPDEGRHCGRCNKCAERAQALASLPGGDPTLYADAIQVV